MQSTTFLIVSMATIVVAFTVLAVYTAFGPPSRELGDPFEDHED
ncbi:MAG: photosystem II reaction center protein PsbN [Leptolyngbyaceae cyanobacterium MO_188.B28]|nr:photosystem II reaction center protein PsbN [Leptolyngbyaceae cyanobacterium MO_188.B28]